MAMQSNDLINRSELLKNLCKGCMSGGTQIGCGAPCPDYEAIRNAPVVDAVLRDEYESLLNRFRHLLQSDYIRSFDEYDPRTHSYKRDISEADAMCARRGKWLYGMQPKWHSAKEPQWHSAKEPPKEYIDKEGVFINYLIYTPEYGVDIGNYIKPANQWLCMGLPSKVTHWATLPESPKEIKQ